MPEPTDLVTIRPGVTLSAPAAASFQRVQKRFGFVNVNSSYRSWTEQWRFYQDYINGVPGAPLALHPDRSMHCKGLAIDTDYVTVMRGAGDYGWRSTVPTEDWHFDYFATLDRHYGEPAGETSKPFPDAPKEDDEMNVILYLYSPTNSLLLVDHLNKTIRNLGNKNNNTLRTWYANNKPYVTVDDPTWAALVTGYAYVDQPNIEPPTIKEG